MRQLTAVLAVATMLCLGLGLSGAAPARAMGSGSSADAPQNPDFAAAKEAIAADDYPRAIELLEKVTAAEPQNADAFNLLGYATRENGQFETAITHYQKALSIDPKHLGAHEYIGEAYLKLGRLDKAKEHLDRLDDLCLFGCKEYRTLKAAIAEYEARS
jgi:Flp pilus assembly protein TadD